MGRAFRNRVLGLAGAAVLTAPCARAQFQIPGFPRKPAATNTNDAQSGANAGLGAGLDEAQIGGGLKQALAVGTERAVKEVARPGGYLENQEIKILLPGNLRNVERVLRTAGQGPKIDEFVASMNHAAEEAAPEAGRIFADAVRSMSINDARQLLTGGNTSITDFFKAKTSAQLTTAFRPHVDEAMGRTGVTAQYDALAGRIGRLPFGGFGGVGGGGNSNSGNFDIHQYVVQKALDGLFFELAQQEKQIRTNPAARTTSLLRAVFGGR